MLGSVSDAAPHGTRLGHCTDENDLMCYQDEASVVLTWDNGCGVQSENSGTLTNDAPENFVLDCNDYDYFDPSRPTSGYLANNWNTADSDFMGYGLHQCWSACIRQSAPGSRVSSRYWRSGG